MHAATSIRSGVTLYQLLAGACRSRRAIRWNGPTATSRASPLLPPSGPECRALCRRSMKLLAKTAGGPLPDRGRAGNRPATLPAAFGEGHGSRPFTLGQHDSPTAPTRSGSTAAKAKRASCSRRSSASSRTVPPSWCWCPAIRRRQVGAGARAAEGSRAGERTVPAGKYDQYKRDIPFATLAHAFGGLIRQILRQGTRISAWREASGGRRTQRPPADRPDPGAGW